MRMIQTKLKDEIKQKIFAGFSRQAIQERGWDGLSEDPISFEMWDGEEFVGAVVVHPFWGQLHIKYLFIEEKYRGKGIGKQLMQRAFDFARQSNVDFAFVETMCFQAAAFYEKLGFVMEFSRTGFAKNMTFHYLKKNLKSALHQVTRIGAYGVIHSDGKMLLIQQQSGPHKGKFDFPGGSIEFGETPEQTLRRELAEEVAMEFSDATLLSNLSAVTQTSDLSFFQIGMIYEVKNPKPIPTVVQLPFFWVDPNTLSEKICSPLLWKHLLLS